MASNQKPLIDQLDKDKLKHKLDVSHFDFNAILRGAQLTMVGGMFSLLSTLEI